MDKITYAYLETTNYCNLDCSFCNRTDVIGPLKHMSLEDWGKSVSYTHLTLPTILPV